MSARRPDEVRAAVMAALLAGQGVSAVARQYGIPKQTVSEWRRSIARQTGQLPGQPGQEKPTLGAMVEALLREALDAAREGMAQVHDSEWRGRQSASELGTFVGIITDKAVRLLEALDASGLGVPGSDGA